MTTPPSTRLPSWRSLAILLLAGLLFLPAYSARVAGEDEPAGDANAGDASAPTDATNQSDGGDAASDAADRAKSDSDAKTTTPVRRPPKVAIIPIKGMIYDFTTDSLKRRTERALDRGATELVIQIDTNGGLVTSALDISRYLKSLPMKKTAWVNPKAISAGIMIASACDEIVMSDNAVTGDCAPIIPGAALPATERRKALDPILTEFRSNASRNGHAFAVLHATAELGVEVWEVEHEETGQKKMVNQLDRQVMVKGVAIEDIGKPSFLQRLMGEQGLDTGSTLKVEAASDEDVGKWKDARSRPVHDGNSLLTVFAREAVDIGLAASGTINSVDDLTDYLGVNQVEFAEETWSERIAAAMTHPIARAILTLLLVLAVYVEMNTPGVGVAGGIALLMVVLLIVPPFIVGLAETWHILAIVAGVILIGVEIFVLPGFGVAGISGILCIIAGLVFIVVPTDDSGNPYIPLPDAQGWAMVGDSLIAVIVGVVGGMAVSAVVSRYIDRVPVFNRLVLKDQQVAFAGTDLVGQQSVESGIAEKALVSIGDVGEVTSELRPSGRARFGGAVVDVASIAGVVDPGNEVRVVKIEGNYIVVEPVEA